MKKEVIFSACEGLLENGVIPSVRAVIEVVGGSARDVAGPVAEWKERRLRVSAKVSRLAEAFNSFDLVERKAFLDTVGLRAKYIPPPRKPKQ